MVTDAGDEEDDEEDRHDADDDYEDDAGAVVVAVRVARVKHDLLRPVLKKIFQSSFF